VLKFEIMSVIVSGVDIGFDDYEIARCCAGYEEAKYETLLTSFGELPVWNWKQTQLLSSRQVCDCVSRLQTEIKKLGQNERREERHEKDETNAMGAWHHIRGVMSLDAARQI